MEPRITQISRISRGRDSLALGKSCICLLTGNVVFLKKTLIVGILMLATVAWAAPSFDDLFANAKSGDVEAQYNLGRSYHLGEGVKQSYVDAVEWYQKAVAKGHAAAQCNLGYCYMMGQGVEKSYEQGLKLYRASAEQGYAEAQSNLAGCYLFGVVGLEKSAENAVKWYRRAAEQGFPVAQYYLGMCYLRGEGAEESVSDALIWLRKAAKQGNEPALQYLREFDAALNKKAEEDAAKVGGVGPLLFLLLIGGIGYALYRIVAWGCSLLGSLFGRDRFVCTMCGATMRRPGKKSGMNWMTTLSLLVLFAGSIYTVSFVSLLWPLPLIVLILDSIIYRKTLKRNCCKK